MTDKRPRPSEVAKKLGFSSLKDLVEYTGESSQNLNNWSKSKPERFKIFVLGAAVKKLMDNSSL